MRKIQEVLRLNHSCGCSIREISNSCEISRSTVSAYLHRAKASGLSWPLPEELSDACLEERLVPSAALPVTGTRFSPDFQKVHKELQSKKHVTLTLLW